MYDSVVLMCLRFFVRLGGVPLESHHRLALSVLTWANLDAIRSSRVNQTISGNIFSYKMSCLCSQA